MTKSDIKKKIWGQAKEEMKSTIVEQAKKCSLITYSDLVNKVISLQLDIELVDQRNIMAEMLGEISLAEDRAGRGMLSALVIHKTGDMEPGQGFFDYAKALGKNISDKTTFWIEEVNKVYGYWAEH